MKTSTVTPDRLARAEEEMAQLADSDGSYMSVGYLNALAEKSDHLLEHIDNGTPLPDWVEAKISQAANAINSVHDFYEFNDGRVRQLTASERSLIAAPRYRDYVRRFKPKPGGPARPMPKDEWEAKVLGAKPKAPVKAPGKEKAPTKEKGEAKRKTPEKKKAPAKTYKKKYAKPVAEVMDKHKLTDDDANEVKAFKKDKPKKGKFVPPSELLRRFLAKAKPETRERMKKVTPGEFMKMLGAIMGEEGEGKMASAFARMAALAGDEITARFEEGVPADPTENMSEEDAAEWERQNEQNRDNFKKSARGKRIQLTPKEVARGDGGWTVVVRPQADGPGYMVAAVHIETGEIHGRPDFVEKKSEVMSAVSDQVRWLSKMGVGGAMADASRTRNVGMFFTASRNSDIDPIDRSEAMLDTVDGAIAEMFKITEDEGSDLDHALDVMARFEEGESVDVPAYLREKGNPEAAEEWEQNTEEYGDKFKKSNLDEALDVMARFEEGESVDVPAYLREKGNPEAAEEWEQNTEEYGDKFKKSASQIGKTILDQMGGPGRLKMMLGINYLKYLPDGVEFAWPNKQRSKGNLVRVTLDPDDTYSVEFFNHSMTGGRKPVRKIEGVYNEMLADVFEKQTGWYLRFASTQRTAQTSNEVVSLWAAVSDGNRLIGVTDQPSGRNFSFWRSKPEADLIEIVRLKDVPIDTAEILADQGTPAQFFANGIEAWKIARRYAPQNFRLARTALSKTESAILEYLGRNGGEAVEMTDLSTAAAGLDNTRFEDVEKAAEALLEKGMILMEGSQIKEASSKASGLYGFTKKTQSDCEAAVRKLTKAATRIARDTYSKDEEVAPFLSTHVKRANSLPAKILVDTLKEMGPKIASRIAEDPRASAWSGWNRDTPVQVVSAKGEEVFQNLAKAQARYPELDPKQGSDNFGWGTKSEVAGAPALRFEHREAIQDPSTNRKAARKDWGLYGFQSKTANLGLHACTALREAAGHIAADLHGRRADSHDHITGFLKSHSKEARCLYSRMIGASYPEADRRCASAQPRSVSDWLSWED